MATTVSAPSHIFRSNSESTALSNHNYTRLRTANHFAAQPSTTLASNGTSASSAAAMGTHLASRQYVQQHRAFVEHQRQLHDEERHLWHLEREELHQRIQALEHMVRQLGGQVDSSFSGAENFPSPQASSVASHASESRSRLSSTTSTGDEFWKGSGGKSTAQPSRSFPESSGYVPPLTDGGPHLPPILESADTTPRKKSVGFKNQPNIIGQDFHVHPIPGMSVHQTRPSLDGITFKPSILASNGNHKNGSRSRSRSPMHSPSKEEIGRALEHTPASEEREPKPQLLNIPASGLTASDLLVKDAGHTPLARITDSASRASSEGTPQVAPQSPTQTALDVTESKPVRPPAERSDSYFPVVDAAAELPPAEDTFVPNGDPPEDPALKGPLALDNTPGSQGSSAFLDELNHKLLEAQKSADNTPTNESPDDKCAKEQKEPRVAESSTIEIDGEEQEPKLRIRRSTNFGSAFGASTVGPGV